MLSLLFIGLLTSVTSVQVSASEYEYLLKDISALEQEVEVLNSKEVMLKNDIEYQNDPELFPRDFEDDSLNTEVQRTGTISDTHVYVRINQTPVVLNDVPLTEWFAPYVRSVGEADVMNGYNNSDGSPRGEFGPADSVTIVQLAKIATVAGGIDTDVCEAEITNESVDDWAKPYVACGTTLRWSIFLDSEIDANRPATRAEVVTTILEAFGTEIQPGTGEVFSDVSSVFIYRGAIETAFNDGIITGYKDETGDDTKLFGPFNKINRAETAKVISLAMQIYGR